MHTPQQVRPGMAQEQLHLQDYLAVITKHLWTVVTCFVIVFTVVLIGTYKQRPVYRATAQLMIEKEYSANPYQELISVDISQQDYYESQYRIMKSRTLARRVMDRLNLERIEEYRTSSDTVTAFLKKVFVEPIPRSRLVNLSAESFDPKLAVRVANTLAHEYVRQNLENKLYANKELLRKLPDPSSLENIAADDERLQSLPSVVNNQLIRTLKEEYARLQAEYANLSRRYKPKHPQMLGLRAQLDQLERRIAQETRNIVESLRIELSGDLKSNNVRIVDPAEEPVNPVRPRKRTNIILGILGGLFLGVGLAFFLEYMDNTIKTDKEVEEILGLAFLGAIPRIRVRSRDRAEQDKKNTFVLTMPKSPASEALKIIRSNVILSAPKENLRIIMLASSSPGEGKSFSSVNLALAFAQAGQETLLVDCDLRRSNVHKLLDIPNIEGMSNYLIGERQLDQIVRKPGIDHFNVITAGPHPPNPAELFSFGKIREFAELVRGRYDRVIIDTAPIMTVSDTINLAGIADGVIFVISAGKNNRQVVIRGRQMLKDAGARIIGGILNNIEYQRHGYYYYYYNRYYSYYGDDRRDAARQRA
jgi:capsular exopolysaccharide synthesis family protein